MIEHKIASTRGGKLIHIATDRRFISAANYRKHGLQGNVICGWSNDPRMIAIVQDVPPEAVTDEEPR